jgi:hypothetical protein
MVPPTAHPATKAVRTNVISVKGIITRNSSLAPEDKQHDYKDDESAVKRNDDEEVNEIRVPISKTRVVGVVTAGVWGAHFTTPVLLGERVGTLLAQFLPATALPFGVCPLPLGIGQADSCTPLTGRNNPPPE